MKRLICALLLVCMLLLLCACGQTAAPAEELGTFTPGGTDFAPTLLAKKGFDPNTIQSRKTFSRNDSGLGWTYYNVYRESYSDGFVIFGIHIESSGTDPDCILLYTRILDRSNNIYFDVDGITFNIGGKSYSFPELEVQERQSMTVLQGDDCYKFIKALADNSTVGVRLYSDDTYVDVSLDKTRYNVSLRAIAQDIVNKNIWSYYTMDPSYADMAEDYPIVIK